MRVLLACPYSWRARGGVQAHVRHLSAHLAARGHEVLVLAPGVGDSGDRRVELVGRPVSVPFNGSRVPLCCGPRSAAAVRRAVRRFAPEVVHVHEPLSPSTGMFATLFAGAPLVATFHAHYGRSFASLLYTAEALVLRSVWSRITQGIAVSKAAATCVRSRVSIPLSIVSNGVDPELFAVPREAGPRHRRSLLFVNRLEPRKGFGLALQAFAKVARAHPDVDLVAVGDGRERHAVARLPDALRARVVQLRDLPDEAVRRRYAEADVFMAPATGCESFGVVLLEAMAAGLPIVASDIDGYREVVRDGIEGLLVPPGDPEALALGLIRVLGDAKLACRLGAAGRVRAGDFTWKKVAGQVEGIYEEARRTFWGGLELLPSET